MFRDIKGYEGLYAVDENGNVWSYRRKIILKPYSDNRGYLKVSLFRNGIADRRRVNRLVLETFCPVEGMEHLDANHLNEQKDDNRLCNLSWLTHKENVNYGTGSARSALSRSKTVEQFTLNGEFIAEYPSVAAAAKQVGGYVSCIATCCRGKTMTSYGYVWRYKNERH